MSNTTFEIGSSNVVLNNIVTAGLILLIPVIMVPSIFVVLAVKFLTKLHTAHNIILLTISVYDILISGVVIPIRLMVDVLDFRYTLYSMRYPCLAIDMIADFIEDSALVIVALLGLDTFIQINFAFRYKRYYSLRNIKAIILAVILAILSFYCVFFCLRYLAEDDCKTTQNVGERAKSVKKVYLILITSNYTICLIFFLVFGIYTRCRVLNLGKSRKMEVWLLLAYVLFYIPLIASFYGIVNADDNKARWLKILPGMIRHMCCINNLVYIYNSRPIYRFAFNFFITTNPIKWNKIETTFNLRRESNKYTPAIAAAHMRSKTEHQDISKIPNENMKRKGSIDTTLLNSDMESDQDSFSLKHGDSPSSIKTQSSRFKQFSSYFFSSSVKSDGASSWSSW